MQRTEAGLIELEMADRVRESIGRIRQRTRARARAEVLARPCSTAGQDARARQEAVFEALWERFCWLRAAEGRPVDEPATDRARHDALCHALRDCPPRGWWFASSLEISTISALATDEDRLAVPFEPVAPEPTDALPGTYDKLRELAARCAAGEDLWHRGDATIGD